MSTGSGGVPVAALVLSSIPHRRSDLVQAVDLQREFHESGLSEVVAHAKQAAHRGGLAGPDAATTSSSTRSRSGRERNNRNGTIGSSGGIRITNAPFAGGDPTSPSQTPTIRGPMTSTSIRSIQAQERTTQEQQQPIPISAVPTVYAAVTASATRPLQSGARLSGATVSSAKRPSDRSASSSQAKRAHTGFAQRTGVAIASSSRGGLRSRQLHYDGNDDDDGDDDDDDDDDDGDDGEGHVGAGADAREQGSQRRGAGMRQHSRAQRRGGSTGTDRRSLPRSSRPANASLDPALLRCSEVPTGFADKRFVYDLPETIDLAMVKQATSYHPQRLREPISVGKIARQGPDIPAIAPDEVLLTFAIFHPQRYKLQQLLVCAASQTLADLRHAISCWTDGLSLDPGLKTHAFFYLEGTFFDEMGSDEPSAHIREWAQDKVARPLSHVSGLSQMRLRDLQLRLFAPYAFVHCVCCEHRIVLTQMRVKNDADPAPWSRYPLVLFQKRPKIRKCQICHSFPATRVTLNDPMAPEAPCLFCNKCFTAATQHESAPPSRVVEPYWHDP